MARDLEQQINHLLNILKFLIDAHLHYLQNKMIYTCKFKQDNNAEMHVQVKYKVSEK